jgi:hypothetical protein
LTFNKLSGCDRGLSIEGFEEEREAKMSKLAEQFDAVAEIARQSFAAGDVVTGVAAIKLAAQLVQIMRLLDPAPEAPADSKRNGKKRR